MAGLGWAAVSAAAQFSADGIPLHLQPLIGGGLLLGALMGSVLGAAQAGGLQRIVRHPWRWILISILAWAPAMAVIFAGATAPRCHGARRKLVAVPDATSRNSDRSGCGRGARARQRAPALVLLPGAPETKRWWRNLDNPSAVRVLLRGEWRVAEGRTLRPHQHGYDEAARAYRARWPQIQTPAGGPPVIVRMELRSASKTDAGWAAV